MGFERWKNERFIIFGINEICGKNNSRKVKNYYLSCEKYSESSENSEKIPRDIMDMRNPNKVFGSHDKIIWSI